MATDITQTVVAGRGEIYVNAADTAEPTTYPYTGWTDLGHTSPDGITMTFELTTEDLTTWQQLGAVRTVGTELTFEVAFTMFQVNEENLGLFFGTNNGIDPVSDRFRVSKTPTPQNKAFIVRMVDGSTAWSFYAPKVAFRSGGEMEVTREGFLTVPVIATVAASDAFTYLATFGGPSLIEA